MAQAPRVFVSYSHDSAEHRERVLALTQELRADWGIDARLDRFEPSPEEGWTRWMQRQFEEAEFVLLVCTETYRRRFEGKEERSDVGLGVNWEGLLAATDLNRAGARNAKYVPVLLEGADPEDVPSVLRDFARFRLPAQTEELVRKLTGQLDVKPADLGPLPELPPLSQGASSLGAGGAAPPVPARYPSELETMIQEMERLRADGADVAAVAERIRAKKAALRQAPVLQRGDVIGEHRYALEELLGTGGFAQVWKAWDRRREAFVALKILHGQHVADESRVRRFFGGARKQSRLKHPHVVRVLEPELRDESGWLFFAMEFVAGITLRAAVLEGTIEREELLGALGGIADALDHASTKHGMVHRDVKPANILLDAAGKAYLSDFDLVHAPESTQGTLLGQGMGTYDFAAPEVLRGEGNASHASDVYSLAMTALWALSGGKARGGGRDPITTALETTVLSSGARAALLRSLDDEPSKRHPGAGALVQDIVAAELLPPPREGDGSASAGQPGDAPPSPRAEPRAGSEQRRGARSPRPRQFQWPSLLGLALAVLGVLFGAVSLIQTMTGSGADAAPSEDGAPGVARPAEGADVVRDAGVRAESIQAERGGYELVLIPAGKFLMGSPEDEEGRYDDEGPQHEVELADFFLGRCPVTNEEYGRFLEANPGTAKPEYWEDPEFNQPKQPVVGVSWAEAQAYCAWAGLVLPTEAQWEYACRAGTKTRYWSGESESDLARVGWYAGNADGRPHAVGEKPANPFGLQDMHGNVLEWCQDTWHDDYAGAPTDGTAWEDGGARDRVFRGGSFDYGARLARSSYRSRWRPGGRGVGLGFRPARLLP